MSGSEFFGPCFVVEWLRWCVWVVWVPQNLMVCQHCLNENRYFNSIPTFSTSRVILLLVTSGYIPLCAHYGWFYTPYPTQIWCLNVSFGGSSHGRMMFTSTKLVAPVAQVMSLHLLQTLSIETVYIYILYTCTWYIHIILYIHTYVRFIYYTYIYIYLDPYINIRRHPLFTFTKMPRKPLLVCCVQWRVRRCHCRFPNSATWLCLDGWMISHKVRPPGPTTR